MDWLGTVTQLRSGLLVAICLGLGACAALQAEEAEQPLPEAPAKQPPAVFLVQLPLPLVGVSDEQFEARVNGILEELPQEGPRPVLVIEFVSQADDAARTSRFERALLIARYLTSEHLARVRTVAWLPQSVTGHAVLPVLACEQIIMAPDAMLGAAGQEESTIDPTLRQGYNEIAQRRRTVPAAVAESMLDKQAVLTRVQTAEGTRFVLAEELTQLRASGAVTAEKTLSREGEPTLFSGRDMRLEMGLASHLASDRQELASALEVAVSAISDRAFLPDATKAVVVKIEGPIHHHAVSWIMRSLEERLSTDDLNLVVLNLHSAGGNLQESLRFADYLARGLPNRGVRSIAVVSEARGDAALVAFACDEIVMTESALLGGPGAATIRPRKGFSLRETVQSLAKARQRDWSLAVGLVDESLEVYRYQRAGGTTVRYLSAEEAESLPDADLWDRGRSVDLRGGMSAPVAIETGLARYVAADFTEMLRRERLENAAVLTPGAVFVFVEWLADKRLAGILLFVAFVALVIEMNTPSVGIMGFTSALCFLLYFWSQFLHGNATALEILLFLGGVACILVEFFVVPGTVIFGFGGVLMVLASIILASQTFIVPMNVYQFRQMPASLFMVILALTGCAAAVALLRQFLPQTPYFNRMILPPPDGEMREAIEKREALTAFEHLLGKPGVATTPLVPGGKAQFGDELVDVLSEGDLIEKGRPVFVVAVNGNHVIVKAADR